MPDRQQDELHLLRQRSREQAAEIQRLRAEIRELRRRRGEMPPEQPMKGLKLALIGPSFREQDYRQALDTTGVQVLFFSSEEKVAKIARGCSKVHGIVYVKTFCGHDVDNQIDPLIKRLGIPTVKLSFKGLERLRETVLSLAPDMQAYKELRQELKEAQS